MTGAEFNSLVQIKKNADAVSKQCAEANELADRIRNREADAFEFRQRLKSGLIPESAINDFAEAISKFWETRQAEAEAVYEAALASYINISDVLDPEGIG